MSSAANLAVAQVYCVIDKDADQAAASNMRNYEMARRNFDWSRIWQEFGTQPGGPLNLVHAALQRHALGPSGASRTAIRWLGGDGKRLEVSYAELYRQVQNFSAALDSLDIPRGAVIASLMGRLPALYVAALGAIYGGRQYCPLFSAFGPEPVAARLALGEVQVLVTTASLYQRKIAALRMRLPALRTVIVVSDDIDHGELTGTLGWQEFLRLARSTAAPAATTANDPALLHFTSGTTGMPKGVVHVHGALIAQYASARLALDLRENDTYWCTADPGWVTGTAYGILAPLACGVTMVVDSADFDAPRWYDILQRERVTVWYTAPTAIRMLRKAGTDLLAGRQFPDLRFLGSVGEPLNAEAVVWSQQHYGKPFHDNWWQTETGAIMIANFACMPIRPGSMGRALPGIEAAVVERLADGQVRELTEPDAIGELALRPGWPSMFQAYLGQPQRYADCFHNGWYLSGDLARCDADGYFWFVGRADDVIKSAGHLVSPFEVESALLRHPAVAQAAVIGIPDPITYQSIKAFVELNPNFTDTPTLRRDLIGHARKLLGTVVAPREIAVLASIPRTRSGKILRRLLRARALGEPEGDLSTLESGT